MHAKSGFADEHPLTWKGGPGFKPILLIIGFGLFILALIAPAPQSSVGFDNPEGPAGI